MLYKDVLLSVNEWICIAGHSAQLWPWSLARLFTDIRFTAVLSHTSTDSIYRLSVGASAARGHPALSITPLHLYASAQQGAKEAVRVLLEQTARNPFQTATAALRASEEEAKKGAEEVEEAEAEVAVGASEGAAEEAAEEGLPKKQSRYQIYRRPVRSCF